MVMQFAGQNPVVNEILLAGIKPLPINRMVRQAGRVKNRSPSGANAGPMHFTRRDPRRIKLSADEVQTLLRSDPQFAASYQRQVVEGMDDKLTDKYRVFGLGDGGVMGQKFAPYATGSGSDRSRITREDLTQLTIERPQRAQDAINNWDPIEASAIEDMNRLRGGRRGPALPDAAGFVMDLETIPTPSNPDGVRLFEGV